MKIVQINMIHNGSTGKIMLGIAAVANEIGHHVWTFSPKIYNRYKPISFPELTGHSYYGSPCENARHIALAEVSGFHGCFSTIGTYQLLKKIERIKPDIIHLHNIHGYVINLPILFAYIKKHNIRVVWTLHDCWAMTGQCPYFTMVKCDKWKTGCQHCEQTGIYPKAYVDQTKLMWRWKKKWFTGIENMTIVTPSQWLAGLVQQSYLKEYPIEVIHNGIDLNIFKPRHSDFREKNKIRDKHIVLGVAFGWGKRKGLDVFIELAKRLPEQYQIILVGTDEQTDAKLPKNIISIHRTQNQQELAEIYTAADVFANPTREDNYPTVNMEALACGTPVLTFRTGGSPEIPDETCGIVVPCDDIDAMEREIIRICTQRPYTEASCLKRANEFDMKARFEDYVILYERGYERNNDQ